MRINTICSALILVILWLAAPVQSLAAADSALSGTSWVLSKFNGQLLLRRGDGATAVVFTRLQ